MVYIRYSFMHMQLQYSTTTSQTTQPRTTPDNTRCHQTQNPFEDWSDSPPLLLLMVSISRMFVWQCELCAALYGMLWSAEIILVLIRYTTATATATATATYTSSSLNSCSWPISYSQTSTDFLLLLQDSGREGGCSRVKERCCIDWYSSFCRSILERQVAQRQGS